MTAVTTRSRRSRVTPRVQELDFLVPALHRPCARSCGTAPVRAVDGGGPWHPGASSSREAVPGMIRPCSRACCKMARACLRRTRWWLRPPAQSCGARPRRYPAQRVRPLRQPRATTTSRRHSGTARAASGFGKDATEAEYIPNAIGSCSHTTRPSVATWRSRYGSGPHGVMDYLAGLAAAVGEHSAPAPGVLRFRAEPDDVLISASPELCVRRSPLPATGLCCHAANSADHSGASRSRSRAVGGLAAPGDARRDRGGQGQPAGPSAPGGGAGASAKSHERLASDLCGRRPACNSEAVARIKVLTPPRARGDRRRGSRTRGSSWPIGRPTSSCRSCRSYGTSSGTGSWPDVSRSSRRFLLTRSPTNSSSEPRVSGRIWRPCARPSTGSQTKIERLLKRNRLASDKSAGGPSSRRSAGAV